MRQIVIYPNPILRQKAVEVKRMDRITRGEMKDLKDRLRESENGAGLAANQIGVNKRFIGIKRNGVVEVLVNPKIVAVFGEKSFPKLMTKDGGEEDFLEGCLSFPNYYGTVKRYLKIEAAWKGGGRVLTGFEAIVFQHEVDHLEGILFIDHVKEDGGKLMVEKEGKMVKAEDDVF